MSNDKIADLKAKFVAGAIPLESDYATLLNMLEETRVATGTSPDTPAGDTGLKIDDNTKVMKVKVPSDGLLDVSSDGLDIPLTSRLRIACGLVSNQPALYGQGHGIYAVAVPRLGYTVLYLFQEPWLVITPGTDYFFHSHDGKKTTPMYYEYEFKYGPALTDGLNVKKAVWPITMNVGDEVSMSYTTFSQTITQDADIMKDTVGITSSYGAVTLEVLP